MEKVINLSAFGDVIANPNKDEITFDFFKRGVNRALDPEEPAKADSHEDSSSPAISTLAIKNLEYLSQIKFFHWQTKSYAEHKALDKLFSGLLELSDALVESAMGKYGRPKAENLQSNYALSDYQEGCLEEYLNSLIHRYTQECKNSLDPKSDSDLLNILDEMIALVNKTKYLLTLK
jgi:hypothetical protein